MKTIALLAALLLLPGAIAAGLDAHAGARDDRSRCATTGTSEGNNVGFPNGSGTESTTDSTTTCESRRDLADAEVDQAGSPVVDVAVGEHGSSSTTRHEENFDGTFDGNASYVHRGTSESQSQDGWGATANGHHVDARRCERSSQASWDTAHNWAGNGWNQTHERDDSTCDYGVFAADHDVVLVRCVDSTEEDDWGGGPVVAKSHGCANEVETDVSPADLLLP